MSVTQATSLAFQTSCEWCNDVRQVLIKPITNVYQGILLGRQLQANYRIAEQLAGHGDYRAMTVLEVASVLNKQSI